MASNGLRRLTRREALAATVSITALAGCPTDETPTETDEPATDTPSTVTDGLQLWLHPDSGYERADGAVTEWTDDSGNGNNMTQSMDDWRPTVASDAANGHDAVQFDGEDDNLQRADTLGIPNDSARTFVVVSRLSDTRGRSPFLMQGRLDSEDQGSNHYGLEANTFNTAGERFGVYLVSSANDTQRRTNTEYNLHILRTEDFPALGNIEQSTAYYINGTEVPFTQTPGGTRNQTFDGDTTAVGSFPTETADSRLDGELAEVRVYDRAISDSERGQIESELLSKYGIGQPPATVTPS